MQEHIDSNLLSPPASGFAARLASYVANALRFWERRRIFYNLILALVVIGNVVFAWPGWREVLSVNLCLGLFVLAVLANVAYCAAYLPDIFVQFSGLDAALRWTRTILFVIGTAFAAIVAHFFSHGMIES
jgi:hypothetical protein